MKDELVLIDSNILVYAYDTSEKTKHQKAKNLLYQCWNGERRFAISLQNLSEFYVIITKKIKIPILEEAGAKVISQLLEFDGFIKLDPKKETISKAIDISIKNNMSYWDSLIEATMIENEIFEIYTENTKDFKSNTIKVINPLQ